MLQQPQDILNLKMVHMFLFDGDEKYKTLESIIKQQLKNEYDQDLVSLLKDNAAKDLSLKTEIYKEYLQKQIAYQLFIIKYNNDINKEDYILLQQEKVLDELKKSILDTDFGFLGIENINSLEDLDLLLDQVYNEEFKKVRNIKSNELKFSDLITLNNSPINGKDEVFNLAGKLRDSFLFGLSGDCFTELSDELMEYYSDMQQDDLENSIVKTDETKDLEQKRKEWDEQSIFTLLQRIFSKTVGQSIKIANGVS